MNEKGLMEQSNAAIKAALELYAADHGKLNDGDSFTNISAFIPATVGISRN